MAAQSPGPALGYGWPWPRIKRRPGLAAAGGVELAAASLELAICQACICHKSDARLSHIAEANCQGKANGRFIKAIGRFIKADGRFIKGSFDAVFPARLGSRT